jgi:hypothetical protein
MKMTAFWDVTPCSLVEVDRRFRGVYCFYHCPDGGGRKLLSSCATSMYSDVKYVCLDRTMAVTSVGP